MAKNIDTPIHRIQGDIIREHVVNYIHDCVGYSKNRRNIIVDLADDLTLIAMEVIFKKIDEGTLCDLLPTLLGFYGFTLRVSKERALLSFLDSVIEKVNIQ